MSYRDFDNGITSEQIRRLRALEEASELRADMTVRWRESERILSILRSIGSSPEDIRGIEDWFNGVKDYKAASKSEHEFRVRTPNGWFHSRFPDQSLVFGNPFFEEEILNGHGSQVVYPTIINEDFFAAMLGGEKRLGHKMVYLPCEGFWFKDPRLDAFCSTSDKKVEILLSNYLVKCAESMGRNVDSKLLIKDHRRPNVLSRIVDRAKTALEADQRFFEGVNAPKRHSNGKILRPSKESSPEDFIHSSFIPKENEVVIVSEAYQKFLGYCLMENLTRVEFKEFKRVAKDLVMEKFQLGLRHDIRNPEGRQTHGWKHLCLMPAPSEQIVEAA